MFPICKIGFMFWWELSAVLFASLKWYSDDFFNSLAPGRSECDSENGILNLILLIGILRSSHDNALRWMPQDLTDDKLTLVQVMAWCRQATSHYLNQCWLSFLSPYGVTRPQWVKKPDRRVVNCLGCSLHKWIIMWKYNHYHLIFISDCE